MKNLREVLQRMPEQFESAGYDFNRFRRVFVGGSLSIWILVIAIYFIYNQAHTLAAFLVACFSALMVTLVLLPLSVAQANRGEKPPSEGD